MDGTFVVDNSVVMAWCFEETGQAYADCVLGSLGEQVALVPGIWPLEVANVLLVAGRTKRLGKAEAMRFISLVRTLPIDVVQASPGRILGEVLALATETGLSAYDAAYLDLAIREGLPLATLDKAMKKAAKRTGVEFFDPQNPPPLYG